MAKFKFRLQRLLDHRRLLEKSAKDAWLKQRAEKVQAEEELSEMRAKRNQLASQTVTQFSDLIQQQHALSRLESLEKSFMAAIAVLENEEEAAYRVWMNAKQDAEAIEKLREKAKEFWDKEMERREQAELDEWAVMRRAA
jgi:flagellar protein FliJ